jgi:hypothetical protein
MWINPRRSYADGAFAAREKQMYRQSIQVCTPESCFFYLITATECFRRAPGIGLPNTRGALRDVDRKYLNRGRSLGPEARVLAASAGI